MPVTVNAVVATAVACAGVGALTTAGVGRFHPGLVVPAGLVAAQGSVHYALGWSHRLHDLGHAGGASGHATHLMRPLEQSELVREAMVAGDSVASHGAPDWPMLAAHAIASVVTAGALALVAGVLGWLVARAEDLTIDVILVDDRAPRAQHSRAHAHHARARLDVAHCDAARVYADTGTPRGISPCPSLRPPPSMPGHRARPPRK